MTSTLVLPEIHIDLHVLMLESLLGCPTLRFDVGQDLPHSKHDIFFFAVTCDAAASAEWHCSAPATENKKGNHDSRQGGFCWFWLELIFFVAATMGL